MPFRANPHYDLRTWTMRAETATLVDDIKQAISLLRRHL
jgi:hypothetical protein